MLVLGIGLGHKAKFSGLGLGTVALALSLALEFGLRQKLKAKILADYRIHHLLPCSIDLSELYFKIHVPYLLTVGTRGRSRLCRTSAIVRACPVSTS